MRRPKKRTVLILAALLLLVGVTVIVWEVNDWPPVRLILKYGFPPTGGPTGNVRTIEGIEFVEIGPGYFRMGSKFNADGGDWLGKLCAPFGLPCGEHPVPSDEMPVHWVEFRRGFWIATTEITNAQYARFDPTHERSPSAMDDDDPVVHVTSEHAKRYCAWLSEKADRLVRLPSEAEWECACRAGCDSEFSFGDDEADLGKYAWFDKSEWRSHAVATRRPNRWGLYDMHGNVWEWCEDTFHGIYEDAPTDGSAWTEGGEEYEPGTQGRVFRGGSFDHPVANCRSANRDRTHPSMVSFDLGFRPAFIFPND